MNRRGEGLARMLDPKTTAESNATYSLAKGNGDNLGIALAQYAGAVYEFGPSGDRGLTFGSDNQFSYKQFCAVLMPTGY